MAASSLEELFERIRAEYLEMPGLSLKLEQVQRLCGVERPLCQRVLDALVDAKILCAKVDGTYARLSDGAIPHLREVQTPEQPDHSSRSKRSGSAATASSWLANH